MASPNIKHARTLRLISYLAHDDGVREVVLQECEGLPLPDVEPIGEHDVEADDESSDIKFFLLFDISTVTQLKDEDRVA